MADAQHLEDRIGRLPLEWNRPNSAFNEGVLDHVSSRAGALDPAFRIPAPRRARARRRRNGPNTARPRRFRSRSGAGRPVPRRRAGSAHDAASEGADGRACVDMVDRSSSTAAPRISSRGRGVVWPEVGEERHLSGSFDRDCLKPLPVELRTVWSSRRARPESLTAARRLSVRCVARCPDGGGGWRSRPPGCCGRLVSRKPPRGAERREPPAVKRAAPAQPAARERRRAAPRTATRSEGRSPPSRTGGCLSERVGHAPGVPPGR